MKKIVWLGTVLFSVASCENAEKLNSEVDRVQIIQDTTLTSSGDSAKAKGEQTLEAIKDKVMDMGSNVDTISIDSTGKDSSTIKP